LGEWENKTNKKEFGEIKDNFVAGLEPVTYCLTIERHGNEQDRKNNGNLKLFKKLNLIFDLPISTNFYSKILHSYEPTAAIVL
jgi:hypothetical protein